MKWVAIDLGRNEIKAAVMDIAGNPTKLLYNNNGRMYSYLPSEGYFSKDSRAYVGVYLPIVGALSPENIKEIKKISEALTEEEMKQLEEAGKKPVVFDEECPETTPERAIRFRRVNPPRRAVGR